MREDELRQASTCAMCKQKIGKSRLPMFYRVTLQLHALNLDAVLRQTSLAAMLGNNAKIAKSMGPDEEMTTPLTEQITFTVCDNCSTRQRSIAELAEMGVANLGSGS